MDDPTNPQRDERPGEQLEQQLIPVHDAWRMSEPVPGPPTAEHVVAPPAFEATDPAGVPEPPTQPTAARGWGAASRGQRVLALAAAGVLVAGGVAVAVATSSGASGTGTTTSSAGQVPGGLTTQPQSGGRAPDGTQGFGGPGGGPGGVAGEEHVEGTVSATTGSTVTVQGTDGTTATYTVTSDTQVVRDGAQARLSDVQVGDAVLVHVLPTTSGGHKTAERVFAGTLPAGGFGGGSGGPGTSSGSGSDDADTT
ncbi:MAG TPA: hypothetical protein VH857_11365 [Actinomycetes bacterium]|nr:hypothetical protein [Actinomycetes bacterium]